MNGLTDFLHGPFAGPLLERIGWTLVHSVWECALIGVLLAGALLVVRRSSARYMAGCAGLVACVIAAAGTFIVLVPANPASNISAAAIDLPAMPVELHSTPAMGTFVDAPAIRAADPPLQRFIPIATVFWLAGVVLLCARHAMGWMTLRRIRRTASPITDTEMLRCLSNLSQRLSVRRPILLTESARVRVPSMIGWIRPMILLPIGALSGLTPMHLEAIFAHEIAHIRRNDYLINLIQTLIETLLFYHPAVWWISKTIREEREHCCDDLAVNLIGNPHDYAAGLAAMEELRSPQALTLAATGGSLMKRIRRLVKPEPRRGMLLPAILAIALVLGVAACSQVMQSKTQAQAQEPATQPATQPVLDSAAHREAPPEAPAGTTPAQLRELRTRAQADYDAKLDEIRSFQKKNPNLDFKDLYDQQLMDYSRSFTDAQLRRIELEAQFGKDHPLVTQARDREQTTSQLYDMLRMQKMSINVKEAEFQRLAAELDATKAMLDRLNQQVGDLTGGGQVKRPTTQPTQEELARISATVRRAFGDVSANGGAPNDAMRMQLETQVQRLQRMIELLSTREKALKEGNDPNDPDLANVEHELQACEAELALAQSQLQSLDRKAAEKPEESMPPGTSDGRRDTLLELRRRLIDRISEQELALAQQEVAQGHPIIEGQRRTIGTLKSALSKADAELASLDAASKPPAPVYYISGVPQPGMYNMQGEQQLQDALSRGGIWPRQEQDQSRFNVVIIHAQPQNGTRSLVVSLPDALSRAMQVEPGDVIIVTDQKTLPLPSDSRYTIEGDVPNPGPRPWNQSMTLLQALVGAGVNPLDAPQRQVEWRRTTHGGEQVIDTIDLRDALTGAAGQRQIQAGDRLTVKPATDPAK